MARETSSFSFQALAAHWRAIVLMLVLVGQRISAGQKRGHHAAYMQAEQMELWSRAALACLTQQLVILQERPAPEDPKEAHALEHMHLVAVCLIGLAMLAAKWKAELKGLSGGAEMPELLMATVLYGAPSDFLDLPAILDSS